MNQETTTMISELRLRRPVLRHAERGEAAMSAIVAAATINPTTYPRAMNPAIPVSTLVLLSLIHRRGGIGAE